MIGKGIFEFEGKKYGFKFGPLAGLYYEQVAGHSITQFFRDMQDGKLVTSLLHYFYGAAKAFNESKKIKDEVTLDSVSDIIEDLGWEECMRIYNESLGIPNMKAPQEVGRTTETTS